MMTVEGSSAPSTGKKAKTEVPGKEVAMLLTAGRPRLPRRPGKVMGCIARFIGPKARTFKSIIRSSSLLGDREQNVRSATRKMVRMSLAVRAEVVKQTALANPIGTKESPQRDEGRKLVMMRVMEGMKRKLVSRNFRRPLMPSH